MGVASGPGQGDQGGVASGPGQGDQGEQEELAELQPSVGPYPGQHGDSQLLFGRDED